MRENCPRKERSLSIIEKGVSLMTYDPGKRLGIEGGASRKQGLQNCRNNIRAVQKIFRQIPQFL